MRKKKVVIKTAKKKAPKKKVVIAPKKKVVIVTAPVPQKPREYKIIKKNKLPLGDNHLVTNDGHGGTLKINERIALRLIAKGYGEYIDRV